jgi:hypothetical protein
MVIVDDVYPARLSNLFDRQAAGRKRTIELGFRPREIESGQPIRMLEDNHLSIVDGRDVGAQNVRLDRDRLANGRYPHIVSIWSGRIPKPAG